MNLRIAPSPTGELHLGNLYVFLANYIFSKQKEKNIILRFDDTDKKRNKSNEKEIKKILNLFDFKFSNVYVQSKRKKLYKSTIKEFLASKFAFSCECSDKEIVCSCQKKYNFSKKHCIKMDTNRLIKLIRKENKKLFLFKNEKEYININNISFPLEIIKDFRITRSNRTFLYHFSSCVDDVNMNIDTIIRAEEWITSMWKHFLIFFSLKKLQTEIKIPNIEHVVLILDKNGKKLSKRDTSLSIKYLLEELQIEKETIKIYLYSLLVRKINKYSYIDDNELIRDVLQNKEKDMILCTKENFHNIFSKPKSSPKFSLDKLIYFNKKLIQNFPFKVQEIIDEFKFTKTLKKFFVINDIFISEISHTFNTRKEFNVYFSFLGKDFDIKDSIKKENVDINYVVKCLILHKQILKKLKEKTYIEYKKVLLTYFDSNNKIIHFLHCIRFGLISKNKGFSINLILNCIKDKYIQNRINLLKKLF